ncbi:hypothetical protein BGX28_007517 [Mortierella sp. GBA30]|nr:hypothetical protein BGX28_007517 [Mortierella sp. GBA30]
MPLHSSGPDQSNSLNVTISQPPQRSTDDRISFVGRPFELEEADEHLARLKHWGFRMIRWIVTWEAIEHHGPGVYDQDFLEYTIKALLKVKEYGFKVMIDFHQDVWSRFSGGSGAPLWTFYAAGLDPHHFAATGAAVVHNTLQDHEPLLRMVWLTNYYKLACASMFTLFYAGRILAPKCTFDNGVNIQDYLQSHFLNAIQALVDKIHQCTDGNGRNLLEDDVVIGYDSWNEPSCGWIGLERLDALPEQHDMRQGEMPTPLQSLMLGEGLAVTDIETYQLKIIGPVKTGVRTIDPSCHPSAASLTIQAPVKAWLSPELRDDYDCIYGFHRDAGFPRAGECLWSQHGVWSIKERKILQHDYFARGPTVDTVSPVNAPLIDWVQDHWLPFAKSVIERVRKIHPTAILFLEPPVYVPPPRLINEKLTDCGTSTHNELLTNMVFTPHHYDDLVLLTKRPVLIGETGLHFDVGLDSAQQAGNSIVRDGVLHDGSKKRHSSWLSFPFGKKPNPTSSTSLQERKAIPTISKQFEQAFDNILEGLDRTLSHYTLWNYSAENGVEYGDGWNGENLSLFSTDVHRATLEEEDLHPLDRGGRAVDQFCRPYPIATVGQPTDISFNRHMKKFRMQTTTENNMDAGGNTEIYVPRLHFIGPEQCEHSFHRSSEVQGNHVQQNRDRNEIILEITISFSPPPDPTFAHKPEQADSYAMQKYPSPFPMDPIFLRICLILDCRRSYPLAAVALILGGISLTGYGLFKFYTSGVNRFPEGIRNDLRKALYYQNYSSEPEKADKAVAYYRLALNAAMQHPDLRVDGEEVTGIMIQLGTLFQDMGRVQEAIDVLAMAFECLVHGRTLGTGNESVRSNSENSDSAANQEEADFEGRQQLEQQPEQHGPRVLDGPMRLKAVGIAQKLGDLYHSIKKDQQAERYYLWSVEQLLKSHDGLLESRSNVSEEERRLQNARDQETMRKQFNFDKLPSWMTKTDLGASLEALGGFYTSKDVYSCNISDAFAGLGNVEDATGWAERGLKVGTTQSGQECDEGCGVLLYNLGMLHEMKGDVLKAEDYYKQSKQHGLKTGFNQCIVESNKALKRLNNANEGTQV